MIPSSSYGSETVPESEAEIEILEPALRCDPDGLAGSQQVETSQSFSHQLLCPCRFPPPHLAR